MTKPELYGGVSLPQPDDYLRAVSQTVETEGIESRESMVRAMESTMSVDARYKKFMELMSAVGMFIEPIDRSTEEYVDDELQIAEAVKFGAAFGGLIIPKVHGQIVKVDQLKINTPKYLFESDGSVEDRHAFGVYLTEYGGHGLVEMGEQTEEVLTEIETRVIPDVAKQRMFRVGCGIAVLSAVDFHMRYNSQKQEEDKARFAEQMQGAHDIDWDAAFRDISNEDV